MRITSDNTIFAFAKDLEPAARVTVPATLEFETLDCYSNQLRTPDAPIDQTDWSRVNPATGPVYIEGAKAGDTLCVTINSIDVHGPGVVVCKKNEGTLGHLFDEFHLKVVDVEDDKVIFQPEDGGEPIRIPVHPMIGVIGVAPEGEPMSTGTPYKHGGNMDNRMVTEGTTLYLPVACDGALFALGDVHAVMGDGEVAVTGLEIPATVNVTVELIQGSCPEFPVLMNHDTISVIVSDESLDVAITKATELMANIVMDLNYLPLHEATMLMSLVGNVEICQVVDPKKTVRFVFPKKYVR